MFRVNVDIIAYTDPRFVQLAKLLGLADHDHARSKVEYLWLECTQRGTTELPVWLVDARLGDGGAEAMVVCELGRYTGGRGDSKTRLMHVCGARERCLWAVGKQEQSSKGGKARAATASRAGGKFTSRAPAAAGSAGTSATSPLTPSPSPSPAPSQEEDQNSDSDTVSPVGSVSTSKPRSRKSKPTEPTDIERTSAMRVLARLGQRNGVSYTGGSEHIRLIVNQLRAGVSELELRAIGGYCQEALGWGTEKPEMGKYLTPETLYGPKTISRYLDPARTWASDAIAEAQRQQQREAAQPALELVP